MALVDGWPDNYVKVIITDDEGKLRGTWHWRGVNQALCGIKGGRVAPYAERMRHEQCERCKEIQKQL